MFLQQFVRANSKEAPVTGGCPSQRTSNAESVSMSWCVIIKSAFGWNMGLLDTIWLLEITILLKSILYLCCVRIIWVRSCCTYPRHHLRLLFLTHWGRVTHICVFNLTIIGSDNGLSPSRCQAIIRTNAGILLIGPLGTNFNEILIGIQAFSFKKMHVKMSSAKWRPFCLGLNVLTHVNKCDRTSPYRISKT